MPLHEHLRELRNRLIVYLVFLVPVGVYAFVQARRIIGILLLPSHGAVSSLVVLSPTEGIYAFLDVALVSAFVVTSPVLIYEVAAFVRPALDPAERRLILVYAPLVLLLFLGGVLFGYFAFLPVVLRFVLGFEQAPFHAFLSLNNYIGFIINLTLPFGLIFELPVVVYGLARAGLLTPTFLRKQRRVAILVIFVVAAAVTPPDALSMLIMVAPMLALYEASILVADLAVRRRPPVL